MGPQASLPLFAQPDAHVEAWRQERAGWLAVLEDWLRQHGSLPRDPCPTAAVAAGLRAGDLAAQLAQAVREAYAAEWFEGYEPRALWAQLRERRGRWGLELQEVERAVRFHTESQRQLQAAGAQEGWTRCVTHSVASTGGIFELRQGASWSELHRWRRRPVPPLRSVVQARLVPHRGEARAQALPEWEREGEQLVRACRPLQPSLR